jgi:hypothetical protein
VCTCRCPKHGIQSPTSAGAKAFICHGLINTTTVDEDMHTAVRVYVTLYSDAVQAMVGRIPSKALLLQRTDRTLYDAAVVTPLEMLAGQPMNVIAGTMERM